MPLLFLQTGSPMGHEKMWVHGSFRAGGFLFIFAHMGEKLDLKFNAQILKQLLAQQITFTDFLTEIFKGNEGKNYLQMCGALKAYHHQNGGAPEVLEFEITQPQFNPAALSGSFNCRFKVSFFFGCDDLHIDKNDIINWQLKIDGSANMMHLNGEEPWSSE